jgi:glycine cleavage system H protein
MNDLKQLLFASTHEWVKVGADGMYWVGISNHAQEALGDVMFVQFPELRAEVIQGQACASIESLKAASDIHAPISGTIVEVNQIAIDAPETINAKPYEVWLFKIKSKGEASIDLELGALLSPAAYDTTL